MLFWIPLVICLFLHNSFYSSENENSMQSLPHSKCNWGWTNLYYSHIQQINFIFVQLKEKKKKTKKRLEKRFVTRFDTFVQTKCMRQDLSGEENRIYSLKAISFAVIQIFGTSNEMQHIILDIKLVVVFFPPVNLLKIHGVESKLLVGYDFCNN